MEENTMQSKINKTEWQVEKGGPHILRARYTVLVICFHKCVKESL